MRVGGDGVTVGLGIADSREAMAPVAGVKRGLS